jgi:hypothetical protein
MAEAGGTDFEQMRRQLSDESERRAAGTRSMLEELERRRAQARDEGLNFTAVTGEQLVAKLGKARSPMIVSQAWSGGTTSPGTLSYSLGIFNPDPDQRIWLFAHVFVGPANVAVDVGDALQAVDVRFPRLTEPAFDGLAIDPGASDSLNFSLEVPAGVQPSNYLGNAFLFAATWHDPAEYLDRSLFVFSVS